MEETLEAMEANMNKLMQNEGVWRLVRGVQQKLFAFIQCLLSAKVFQGMNPA